MTTLPTSVTHDQIREVARALKIAPHLVREARVTHEGAHVTLYLRDREGRVIQHGDGPLTTAVHLPVHREEVSSHAAP
ncbi:MULTISPECIES: hypothetical protein [Streptomyces]|uniref:hypothetical protein n=1 Tax=Streptomyces TaxID=1883 RepID=UPI00101E2392|nr:MULTISPECIES: hypothetical protein [Streptomyces]MCO6747855.1 hypothetical protein [Streptomyces sp. IpFD-1.1]RZD85273.1 hypothetical protein C0Q60_07680 [Streptomyces albidoflavus]RZE01583.1 hypothetical protein C0Q62_07580 [Streptomyces albidoflavus]